MRLLVRLAALATAGFFGAEAARRPVRGGRRVVVLTLVGVLTVTLVVDVGCGGFTTGRRVAAIMGAYSLALAAWLGGLVAVAVLLVPRTTERAGSGLEAVLLAGRPERARAGGHRNGEHLIAGGTTTSRSGALLLVEVPCSPRRGR